MNYNPFSRTKLFSRTLARYPKKLNIFDRLVGRPDSMGIFDYLFVAPFIFKALFYASKGKTALRVIFGLITAPIAIAKFFLFIAVSPLVLLGYGVKALVNIGVRKHHENKASDYMKAISNLQVQNPTNPNGKTVTLATALGRGLVNKDMRNYSICTNNKNQLVLKTFPMGTVKAVFAETRENITALSKLMANREHNRLSYFMKYAYRDIFDFNGVQKIAQIRQQLRDNAALSSVLYLNKILVKSPKTDKAPIDLGDLPKDVRLIIADKVFRSIEPVKFFANFKPEELKNAVGYYNQLPPAAKKL